MQFLSTPSARRATELGFTDVDAIEISIHALREEGDKTVDEIGKQLGIFLSTPSARRATIIRADFKGTENISIHALREEGDSKSRDSGNTILQFLSTPSARRATLREKCRCEESNYFYPRPPRGGRPVM